VEGAELLGKLTSNRFWCKMTILRTTAIKGRDRWVELVMVVDESSRTMGGDGSQCGVASPVLPAPYIRSMCCEALHRGMPSTGGEVASMRLD
jgi:hypothetical protein